MPNRRALEFKCEAKLWAMPGVGLESATRTPRANGERTKRAGKRRGGILSEFIHSASFRW